MFPLSLRSKLLVVVVPSMLCFGGGYLFAGQENSAAPPSGAPSQMRLCEDNSCETLIWRGTYYDGVRGSDVVNHYTVAQWSKSQIRLESKSVSPVSVNRTSIGGFPISSKIYVEGVFTGTIASDGHSVENGVVSWKLGSQHGEKIFKMSWEADPSESAAVPACSDPAGNLPAPSALEVCDGGCVTKNNRNVATWIFQGTKGTGDWQQGSKASLTIQEWSNGKVTISREDVPTSASAGLSAVYRGSVCGGTIKGTGTAHWPGHVNDKDFSFPWTATIPVTSCDGAGDDTLALMDVGKTAIRFRQPNSAFKCFSRAAELGDRDARTVTGLMYRDGIGTKVSYPDAMRYLKQSAIQGDYNAQLAMGQIYDLGLGVQADAAQAKDWQTRAYNNPVAVAYRQNRQDQKDMEQMAFVGLCGLVEAMASPSVYVVR